MGEYEERAMPTEFTTPDISTLCCMRYLWGFSRLVLPLIIIKQPNISQKVYQSCESSFFPRGIRVTVSSPSFRSR
jgi:hypothetical protein